MFSCLGLCRRGSIEETRPLLPQYEDDTTLQARLHQKLHSYQMVRALGNGYMPSTEQLIILLRSLLASDILNPDESNLSDSGRLLAKHSKLWLGTFLELVLHKNARDQLQDFMWFLTRSRLSLNTKNLAENASKIKSKADAEAAYQSIRTVGTLLLANSDFRYLLSDLQFVGREVFKDSAIAVSHVAENVGKEVDPANRANDMATSSRADSTPPSQADLVADLKDFSATVEGGVSTIGHDTRQSVAEHLSGSEKETLLSRLKGAVESLRRRKDYSEASSTIVMLLKRYAMTYSRAMENAADEAANDLEINEEVNYALHELWLLVSSFGDAKEWAQLQSLFENFVKEHKSSPEFEYIINEIADLAQKALMDPEFFAGGESESSRIQNLYSKAGSNSSLNDELRSILQQLQKTFHSVMQDNDVAKLIERSKQILDILSPLHSHINGDLVSDLINVFAPLLIKAVQYIPIPRLEISVPEMDLLLENLIIEPGKTVNNTSFLPFRFKLETFNDVEIRKAITRTITRTQSFFTIKIDGLSVRAEEIGFWLRAHSGFLRLADEGIASFELDERGIDIHIDFELGQDRLEKMISLKAVRVHIHKLSYHLRKSKLSFLAWLFRPVMRPLIRKIIEKQLATAIADLFHAANRELVFARERLRATRIADPQDMMTFFKAILTRLTPEPDPDLYTRVGVVQPGKGIFKGVYAPGSVVKLWNEQALRAPEIIDDFDRGGWRNEVFDLTTTPANG